MKYLKLFLLFLKLNYFDFKRNLLALKNVLNAPKWRLQ